MVNAMSAKLAIEIDFEQSVNLINQWGMAATANPNPNPYSQLLVPWPLWAFPQALPALPVPAGPTPPSLTVPWVTPANYA